MDEVEKLNLSLNGCGYLGIYHVGVCGAIRKHRPEILRHKISGGSVGALVACAFMCEVPLEICTRYVLDVSARVRGGILGPMSPDLDVMRLLHDYMDKMLPDGAARMCDGRLHVSVTRFEDGKNVLLDRFRNRQELLQALMCSCFIPVYCGYEPPVFNGVAYVDAALSNNSPCLDEWTVTVAPFSGNSDICPDNDGHHTPKAFTLSRTSIGLTAQNAYMMFRVLFPGTPDLQKGFCHRGYNDGLRFLRDRGLYPCSECGGSTNHSTCAPPNVLLPPEMDQEIESAIGDFRQRLGYRLFQYRSMKVLYYVNMPSIVTAKVAYVFISAILQKVQNKAGLHMDDLWVQFLQVLKEGLYRPNDKRKSSKAVEHSEKEAKEAPDAAKTADSNAKVNAKTFGKACQLDLEEFAEQSEMKDTYIC
ncbi:patanin-like phospholipase domain-containing protein atgl-1 [Uloborus diversus]|uniref:patanin-like phospholipase domain-containing protein atgl-1 n=1 Tax=Uloborus diversus TaxID=327109 RepID=UPI002409FCF9|nr:patanin-like phospholipase domain-containing protein atgl-1 [Uloborus diversus]